MSEDFSHFHCCQPGVTYDDVTLEQRVQPDGVTTYWMATQPIGTLFGSEVHGECRGIGKTKEQALERLQEEKRKLYESLWV